MALNKYTKRCIVCKKKDKREGSLFCFKCKDKDVFVKIKAFRESPEFRVGIYPGRPRYGRLHGK